MQRFQKLLFMCQEIRPDSPGLRQALQLIQANSAEMTVAIFQPNVPKSLAEYQEQMDSALVESMKAELTRMASKEEGLDADALARRCQIEVVHDAHPAVETVRMVLKHRFDVLIKDSELVDHGLHAIDMTLLRKCPVPVSLCRPFTASTTSKPVVAVAIDPMSDEQAGYDLAVELIKLSASMAERLQATLYVLSCWEWAWERTVRGSAFVSLPQERIDEELEQVRGTHAQALEKIIGDANIHYPYEPMVQKGKADVLIPAMLQEIEADVLVMGTVARTGIPGFLIGNTAENIVKQVGCSMLAVKPNGFVSPIGVYA